MTADRSAPPVPFMASAEVRRHFLEFFRERGHAVIASSSLVPGNDPTLLFTNAGMVQFKDCFLGKDQRSYTRAATSQRCVPRRSTRMSPTTVGATKPGVPAAVPTFGALAEVAADPLAVTGLPSCAL